MSHTVHHVSSGPPPRNADRNTGPTLLPAHVHTHSGSFAALLHQDAGWQPFRELGHVGDDSYHAVRRLDVG
jgi:hypothetical protein